MLTILAQVSQPAELYEAFSNSSFAEIPPEFLIGLAGLMIAWGLVNLLFGWRIIKVILAVYGLIGGASLGAILGSSWGPAGTIGGAIGGGLLGGAVCYLLVYVVVFLLGAGVGFGVMITIMPSQSLLMLIIAGVVGLACGLVAFHFREVVLIVFTSLAGASQITNGIWFFLGENLPGQLDTMQNRAADPLAFMQQYKLMLICYGGLSLIGILTQHGMYKKKKLADAKARKAALPEEAQREAGQGGAMPTFNKPPASAPDRQGRSAGPGWTRRLPQLPLVRVAVLVITMGLIAAAVWSEAAAQDILAEAKQLQNQGLTEKAQSHAAQIVEHYPVSFAVIDARAILTQAAASQPSSQATTGPAEGSAIGPTGLYWQPLIGGALATLAGAILLIARRHNRLLLLASLALLIAGVAWTLGQLAWYDIFPLGPLGSLAGAVMANPMIAYIVSYALLAASIALALSPQPDAPDTKLEYVDDEDEDIEWV